MAKILLVEDDSELAQAVVLSLQAYRHEIQHVVDGEEGLIFIETYHFDLFILDWDLPKVSGLEICRRVKAAGNRTPVLMLTGKTSIQEKEQGFDAGADDYLTKPFHKRELLARVKALTRRQDSPVAGAISFADLTIDFSAQEVYKNGTAIKLSGKERELLTLLIKHSGEMVSTTKILNSGCLADKDSTPDIAAHINKIQAKLRAAGSSVEIEKHTGIGFSLRQAPSTTAHSPATQDEDAIPAQPERQSAE